MIDGQVGWNRVTARVPASSANLGAGFDCVGVAVDKWLTVSVTRATRGGDAPALERSGTLSDVTVPPSDDRVVAGFRAACAVAGRPPGNIRVQATSEIPVSRGLGSSAAATVAGAAAANALLSLQLDAHAIAAACADVEGHADNVAPALWGGARLVVRNGKLRVSELAVSRNVAFVLAAPDFPLDTSRARAVLPKEVPHAVATRGAALSAALVQGLATGDGELLSAALDDVLHVPHRKTLVRGYDEVTGTARAAGAFGATLSGSGPTILAVTPAQSAARVADAMRDAWSGLGVRAMCFVNPSHVAGCTVSGASDQEEQWQ